MPSPAVCRREYSTVSQREAIAPNRRAEADKDLLQLARVVHVQVFVSTRETALKIPVYWAELLSLIDLMHAQESCVQAGSTRRPPARREHCIPSGEGLSHGRACAGRHVHVVRKLVLERGSSQLDGSLKLLDLGDGNIMREGNELCSYVLSWGPVWRSSDV